MISWQKAKNEKALWQELAEFSHAVLILDYDGTLAPFVPDPAKAVPYPGVAEELERILHAGARVVFVTGRQCEDIPRLMGLSAPPEVWGSHGGERLLPDGTKQAMELTTRQAVGFDKAESWAMGAGWGNALERKPGCMSFHLRGLDEAQHESARDAVVAAWGPLSRESGLALRDFDGGVELRVPDINKGHAVRTILQESGSDAAVFYLGDDFTDEDGFEALGSRGVSVLVREQKRPSSASWWVRPPEELLALLRRVASLCERAR